MGSRSDDRVWRLIAVLQSTAPLTAALAKTLYETAVRLHLGRKESENVAGAEGVGTVRSVGGDLLLGTIAGPGFSALIDAPAGRCEVSFIVTREGVDHAEDEARRAREQAVAWN